jgi:hypothetical protein
MLWPQPLESCSNLDFEIVAAKKNKNLHQTHFALTPSDAALPTPTLSAGESKVSGGESKVSLRVGLPRSSLTPRSKPKMASLYSWRPSRDSCYVSPW